MKQEEDISFQLLPMQQPRNLGTMTGYGIFYEGNPAASHDAQQEQTMLPSGILLASPTPVGQVFDSFEIVASPEVAAVAAEASQTAQTEDPDTNEEDNGDTTQDEGANDNDDNEIMTMTMMEPMTID